MRSPLSEVFMSAKKKSFSWKSVLLEIVRVVVAALAGSLAGCKFALFNI